MIEFELKFTLTCKCGCRGLIGREDKNDNYVSLIELAKKEGWEIDETNGEVICPYCLKIVRS